jgi:ectoine hydroxylase-related dioxygenase (phytanoyl-CoA dioxygenase family)
MASPVSRDDDLVSSSIEINAEDIRHFEEDGIVCLRGAFPKEWVDTLRQAAEESMQDPGELHAELAEQRNEKGRFFHDTFIWQRNATCRRFVFESEAASIASRLIKSRKINVVFDQRLIKEPGTETATPWHNDMPYWPIAGRQICSIWLALDPVRAESGAVQYVKGSHLWAEKYKPASFSGGDQYTEDLPPVPDIDGERDRYDIVAYDLEPGDCTVHHGYLVHGSPGNSSSTLRRRAYVSRWAGDDAVFHPREGIQEMPPLPNIAPGAPLDSDLWPRVIG